MLHLSQVTLDTWTYLFLVLYYRLIMDTGKRPQKAVKEIQQVSKRSELKRFKGQSSEVVEELKRTGERAWPWDKKRIWEMERERKSKKTFMMMQTWQPEEKKEKITRTKNKAQFNLLQSNNKKDTKLIKQQKKYSQGLPFYLEGWEKKWNFCKMNHQSWWRVECEWASSQQRSRKECIVDGTFFSDFKKILW